MNSTATCLHAVEGRVRIRVHSMKRNPGKAAVLRELILALPGVDSAQTNATTGSVVIHYRRRETDRDELLRGLETVGLRLRQPRPGAKLARGVALSIAEIACHRLLTAIVLA